MKLSHPTLPVLLTLALLFLVAADRTPAQNSDPFGGGAGAGGQVKKSSAQTEPITQENARFDLEFVGTPAPEAFEYIAQKMEELGGAPLNIVYSKAAEAITLPTMTLRQITFEQFVSFINRIGGGWSSDEGGYDPFSGEPSFPAHSGPRYGISNNEGIWYFWAEESTSETALGGMDAEGVGGAETVTEVFALDGDPEHTLGLIEEALSETRHHSNRPEPKLKFHEPSSTLIVSGNTADLQLIADVISAMEIRETKLRQQETDSLVTALAEEIKALKREIELSQRMAEEEKARISARAEQEIAILQDELAKARRTFADSHPKILELQTQLEKALEELEKKK